MIPTAPCWSAPWRIRLVEAFASIAHGKLRLLWNIPEESGVRPACGYPSQPDHREKETVLCRFMPGRKRA